jgi:Gly-Xaa carboxypeptidase
MAEKQGSPVNPPPSRATQPTTSSNSKRWLTAAAALLALPALGYYAVGPANIKTIQSNIPEWKYFVPSYSAALLSAARCPAQPSALNVGDNWDPVTDESFAKLAATRLSKAVQINTESFDDMPQDGSDPAFDHHRKFSSWLESEYPALFSSPIRHEYVNSHAHLFTWEGSNPSLPPIVLMAHTDTVPVLPATIDQWTFPPFEGRIVENATEETPGTWIWGRGSSDCKNQMLGIYNAVEKLLSEGFKPERTILIVNGFDEEVSAVHVGAPY